MNLLNAFRSRGKYQMVKRSGFWDAEWYSNRYLQPGDDKHDALNHFMQIGWREGFDPGPHFSVKDYLEANPDVRQAGMNPLVHFLALGKKENRPLKIYLPSPEESAACEPVAEAEVNQSPDCNAQSYTFVSPEDVALVRASGLFDDEWYLKANPDLMGTGMDPVYHYLAFGWHEGRSVGPLFPAESYKAHYPDLAALPFSCIYHYVKFGKNEGRPLPKNMPFITPDRLYETVYMRQQSEYSIGELASKCDLLKYKPLISIIIPIYNTPLALIKSAVESIQSQIYKNFEMLAVDDGSEDLRASAYLKKLSLKDPRIKLISLAENKGISNATNVGLTMSKGDYIAFMDHDDEITPDAFFWFVNAVNEFPDSDFIYSDEAIIDMDGRFIDCLLKPDWSPERLMSFMYTGHMTMVKSKLAKDIGFDSRFDFAQDFDFALKCTEKAAGIRHIERILYLWRSVPGSAAHDPAQLEGDKKRINNIAKEALMEAYKRRGLNISLTSPHGIYARVNSATKKMVSIIIAGQNEEILSSVIDNIITQTSYPGYEVILVSDGQTLYELKKKYSYRADLLYAAYHEQWSIAGAYNFGAGRAKGEILVFMSPAIRVQEKAWLDVLTEYLYVPGVGGSCLKIMDAEHRYIHSAGYYTADNDLFAPRYHGYVNHHNLPSYHKSYSQLHYWIQNISVLSPELFAVTKQAFEQCGGFDIENIPSYNVIPCLSLKMLDLGYRNVYNPFSETLWLNEVAEKEDIREYGEEENWYIYEKWSQYLANDPYFKHSLKCVFETAGNKQRQMYITVNKNINKDNVFLLITHKLDRTGAPMIIFNLAKTIKKLGYVPIVVSPEDGELRYELVKLDITVIVDTGLSYNDYMTADHRSFLRLARASRLIIANTTVSFPAVKALQENDINFIWWLHEGEMGIANSSYFPDFLQCVKKANTIYLGSPYCDSFIKKINPELQTKVMLYGIEDSRKEESREANDKLKFVMVGSFDERKAQDIVIDAVLALPEDTRDIIEVHIVCLIYEKEFYREQMEKIKGMPQFFIHENLPNPEVIEMMHASDVLLCPSRDDPMPLVVAEAMMCGKCCVVSDHTGFAGLITDKEDGFVVPAGDAEALVDCIEYMAGHRAELKGIGSGGRQLYEQYFSMEVFEKSINSLIDETIVLSGSNDNAESI